MVVRDLFGASRRRRTLRAAEARFHAVFSQAVVPMAIIGLEGEQRGIVLDANLAYAKMLGRPLQQLLGRRLSGWVHPAEHEFGITEPLQRLACGEVERIEIERCYQHANGRLIHALVTATVITDADGQRLVIGQITDLTERRGIADELEELAEQLPPATATGDREAACNGSSDWLIDAAGRERFVLHAQPVVPVCSGGQPRFELLLRVRDDSGELIAPSAFLFDAERFGLIEQIDRWVMGQAVELIAAHQAAGMPIVLSVNLSARTLNAGGVADHLARLLARQPIPPGSLVIEITETAAVADIEQAKELARELRALGCALALDDFGAGFATFYYLKHLEFDYVKIDGEFIRQLPVNVADQLVVRSLVEIARGLGSDTIAEFVQDDQTLALLRQFGVGYAQGYHTGKPGPLELTLPACPPRSRHLPAPEPTPRSAATLA